MFGNKGLRWRLAAALAAAALLGIYSAREGSARNPSVWDCLAQPERWKDRTIWVPVAIVLSGDATEHVIWTGEAKIRVSGPAPVSPGGRASYVAVFRADGPRLESVRARVLPATNTSRTIMEVVSVLVLLGVLANFGRHFLFRPKALQVEGEAP